jgi:beta-lactamase regulating signal transducer with metallopeptidase domain
MILVAGIFRPTLLISTRASELLNEREMQVAIRHELAHVRFRDNLRRLVLGFCGFPLLAGLERKWMQAAELAADDSAATDEASALDLASTLLKMANRSCAAPNPEVAMSLLSEGDNALQARVERLLAWHPAAKRGSHRFLFAAAAVSGIVLLAMNYGSLLGHVHELTELFVR